MIIDANDMILGRLGSFVAKQVLLGNNVDVINCEEAVVSGKKANVFANYIRIGGMVVIGALIAVSIFIISNTIKLTVTSRSREINIMKYVGATNGYIKGPFVMEGILFGLIGAGLSIAIVYYGYGYFFNSVNEQIYSIFAIMLVIMMVGIAIDGIIFKRLENKVMSRWGLR